MDSSLGCFCVTSIWDKRVSEVCFKKKIPSLSKKVTMLEMIKHIFNKVIVFKWFLTIAPCGPAVNMQNLLTRSPS